MAKLMRQANARHGLITTADALRSGVSKDQLGHLVAAGVLCRLYRGVYKVAATAASLEQRALAACLACGAGAVASHGTAGALWGITAEAETTEVTLPRGRRSGRHAFSVHRSAHLPKRDVGVRGGIPITRIERTLVDLAGTLSPAALERALDDALRRELVSPDRLLRYARAMPRNRRGLGTLMRFVRDRAGRGVPGSELEAIAIRLLRQARLPQPRRQHPVVIDGHTYLIDLAYPEQRVAIELEGRGPHWGRERWQHDHDRHYRLEIAGWRPVYFTWDDATTRPLKFVLHAAEALGLWPSRWVAAPPSGDRRGDSGATLGGRRTVKGH